MIFLLLQFITTINAINPNCSLSYCETCENETCTKCISNYILQQNECKYFKEIYPYCQQYNNEKMECELCTSGYTLQEGICREELHCKTIRKGICTDCVDSYYHSTFTHKCTKCSENCKQCIGSLCKECFSGYALELSTCHIASIPNCHVYQSISECKQCDYGYGIVSESFLCGKCDDGNCLQCDYNQSVCTQCGGDYVLINGSCIQIQTVSHCTEYDIQSLNCTTCESGYYINPNENNCMECENEHCLSCQSNGECDKCVDGYYLENGDCLQCLSPCETCTGKESTKCLSCKKGYYFNETSKSCHQCSSDCLDCTDLSHCTICIDGYYSNESYECLSCSTLNGMNCKTCSNRECFSCENGKELVTIQISHDKSIDNSNEKETISICRTVIDNCLEYSLTSDECQICSIGYLLQNGKCIESSINCREYDNQTNKCLSCHDGYYLTKSFTCDYCSSTCKTCEHSSELCSSFFEGYQLTGKGTCQTTTCQQSNCAECLSSTSSCAKCIDGYYLSNGICKSCGNNCKTCDSNGYCIECAIENTPTDLIITTKPDKNGDCIVIDYYPEEDDGLEKKDIIMIVSIVVVIVFFIVFIVSIFLLKFLHKWILKKIDPHSSAKYQRLP